MDIIQKPEKLSIYGINSTASAHHIQIHPGLFVMVLSIPRT